jgi:hypothetical protein
LTTAVARRTGLSRPVRHAALTTALVLAVCAALGGAALASYRSATGELRTLTGRATGTVLGAQGGAAVVEWRGTRFTVPVTGPVPAAGTRTRIAFDPARPATAIIPGATVLTDADRSLDGVLFAALVAVLVLVADCWLLVTRWLAARRPARQLVVRRISMRRGLLARTWLETDSLWIPVYFEPEVLLLPAPATVTVRGDRLVAVDVGGRTLYPSGRVRRTEPPGRRTDSPTRPDDHAVGRAARAARLTGQLRVDLALAVPAPLVGVLWAYLDDGGVPAALDATAITAALALWWAAIRGADPS